VQLNAVEQSGVRLSLHTDDSPESPREWSNLGTMVCSHRRYDLGDEQANTEDYVGWDSWLAGEVLDKHEAGSVVFLPLYLYDHSGITMNTTGFSCPWDSGQVGWIWATKKTFREETGYTEAELFSKDSHRRPEVGEHVKVKDFEGEGWAKVTLVTKENYVVDFDYCKTPTARDPQRQWAVPFANVVEVMANRAEEMLRNEVKSYDDYLRGNVYGYVLERKVECSCCGNVTWEHIDSCWGFYGDDAVEQMKESVGEYEELFDELKTRN